MTSPRGYPDVIASAESGRPLQRGVKMLTIDVGGQKFTFGQPEWWASIDDPADTQGPPGGAGQGETCDPDATRDQGHPRGMWFVAAGCGARFRWRAEGVREI
jgi:hypothetical protein